MVNVNDIYLVMSTVAVLHEVPQPKNIDVKELEKLLNPPITVVGPTPAGILISSQRDQIEIITGSNKTDFRDLSGKTDFSSSKIGMVVEYFVSEFRLKVKTYGVNFILTVPNPEPQKWIMENILSSEFSKKIGKKLVGGRGTVTLKSGRWDWNVAFEASEGCRIAVNFNASEDKDTVPGAEALKTELKTQWDSLVKALNDLSL